MKSATYGAAIIFVMTAACAPPGYMYDTGSFTPRPIEQPYPPSPPRLLEASAPMSPPTQVAPPPDAVASARPVKPPMNPWWTEQGSGYPPTYIDANNSYDDGRMGIVWAMQDFTLQKPNGENAYPYLSRIFAVEFDCYHYRHRPFYDSFFEDHKGAGRVVQSGSDVMRWAPDSERPDPIRKRACPWMPD